MCLYLYRYICVCDVYCDIDTCIMYVICVLFNNLSNINVYFLCTVYPSSSWRSLWSLQCWPGSSAASSIDSSGCLISAGTSGDFPGYFAHLFGYSA